MSVDQNATAIGIETLFEIDGGPALGFYTRGHHDRDAFLRALLEHVAEEGYEEVLPYRKVGDGFYPNLHAWDVSVEWWRWVPFWDGDCLLGMGQHKAEPRSRGAFKVTWWGRL